MLRNLPNNLIHVEHLFYSKFFGCAWSAHGMDELAERAVKKQRTSEGGGRKEVGRLLSRSTGWLLALPVSSEERKFIFHVQREREMANCWDAETLLLSNIDFSLLRIFRRIFALSRRWNWNSRESLLLLRHHHRHTKFPSSAGCCFLCHDERIKKICVVSGLLIITSRQKWIKLIPQLASPHFWLQLFQFRIR